VEIFKIQKRCVHSQSSVAALQNGPFPTFSLYEKCCEGDLQVPFYYPKNEFQTFDISPGASFVEQSPQELEKMARDAIIKMTRVASDELKITQSYTGADGITHIYFARTIGRVPVDNELAAVHIKDGQILAKSASFNSDGDGFADNDDSSQVVVSLDEAVKNASNQLGAPRDDFPATNVYVKIPSGKRVFAHQFQLRDDSKSKWFQVAVDTKTGTVVSVVDYYQSATYKAIQFPNGNADQGFGVAIDPADKVASPIGWHATATESFNGTQGNNIDSRIGTERVDGGESLVFDHNWDATQGPEAVENKKASIINNFYVSNVIHDIMYQYGFTEASGNFQASNFGKGGEEGDSVIVNNQAPGVNNASTFC
jgi:hypothetical protein